MKAAFAKTLGRMSGRATMETENSEATVTTPKSASRTPRGSVHYLRHAFTSLKPRPSPLLLNESLTSLKRRPSPVCGDSVKVFVRVKPVMEDDLKQGRSKEALDICVKEGKRGIVLPAANSKENWFSDFDGVLDDSTNHEVFDAIGGDLLRQYLSGINVSIMAYGQTGSGKTYTMFGCNEPDAQAQGLLHLVLNRIDEQTCLQTHLTRLSVSVFEVYNDELYSLVDAAGVEKKPLSKGMTDYYQHRPKQVNDACEATSLVLQALQHRARDATVRNATSSRSHAFVKLRLEQLPAGPDEQGVDSTLFLVDLAGSESMSNASSRTQESETIHINKSLQALERVVNSLSNNSNHVPYRDSLLTQVLQEGLSPLKARVALVTTVSRFQGDVHVTKSTLMFAQRARNIRTFAQVNVAAKRPPQSCPDEIYRQLQNMQAINNKLRQQLADLESSQERQQGRSLHVEAMREELARHADLHSELQRTSARQQHEAEAALEVERAAHVATRAALVEAQRVNGELQAATAAAEDEARGAARAAAELRSRLSEAQLQLVRLNGEMAGSQSLAAQVQSQHKAAHEQLVQARDQLTVLRGQLAVAEAGGAEHQRLLHERLTQLTAEATAARDSATSEASSFQLRLEELHLQLSEANQDAAELAEELLDARQQVAVLQQHITDISSSTQQEDGGRDDSPAVEPEEQVLAVEHERAVADAALCLQQLREPPSQSQLPGLQEEEGVEGAAVREAAEQVSEEEEEEELRSESTDSALALVNELEITQAQLEACTSQLAEADMQLEGTREQLAEAREQTAEAEARLAAVCSAAEAEGAALRHQLAEAAVLRQQLAEAVAARSAAATAAAQEARSAAEAAAAERLVPLQTECERLRAMCALSEQQLGRLQAECERLRAEGGEAREDMLRMQAERDRAREAAQRAEADRLARLGAPREEREVAPQTDTVKQLQERLRLLEADKKRSEADHKGQLQLKEKLIRQLELMNCQLQSAVTNVRQDTLAPHEQPGGSGDGASAAGASGSSPFASQQQQHGSRSEAGASPGPNDDAGAGTPPVSSSGPPSRVPSSGGILLMNRTTTSSAAALARNNSRARQDFSTPPPAPRFPPGGGHSPSPGPSITPLNPKAGMLTPAPAAAEVLDLGGSVTSTPGPTPPSLMPVACPPLHDGLVVVMRGTHQHSPDLKLTTNAVRNQMNY